ncbi:4Fe-4S binding protein [Anaerobranca gottschalkii]|nr:4Fe-4S binding protein [Anaerobranca gottschalkii]
MYNDYIIKILVEEHSIDVVSFGEKSDGTKYVIAGVILPKGLRDTQNLVDVSGSYFQLFNKLRKGFAQSFSLLERYNYRCQGVSPISVKEDLRGLARIAGIGERGLNRSILHKDYGCNLLFSAFYTNAPIKPFRGKVPDYCFKCGACIEVCPGKAISQRGVSIPRCTPYSLRACQKCLDICPVGNKKEDIYERKNFDNR